MPEFLTLTGTLRASASSDVAADVAGKVVATFVERGQAVKKGQTIAVVDARSAALAATAAQAQSRVAQEQLQEARRDCARVTSQLHASRIRPPASQPMVTGLGSNSAAITPAGR